MKFSLRFLLFVAPCILVAAYFSIWNVQDYFEGKRHQRFLSPWRGTQLNIDDLAKHISKNDITPDELSIADLNRWFSGELPATSSASQLIKDYDFREFKKDLWGSVFVAVGLDEKILPTQDATNAKSIGFYSNGKDGVSISNGCDLDDLASWRLDAGLSYYENMEEITSSRNRKITALLILLTGVIGTLLLWGISVFGYWMLFRKV